MTAILFSRAIGPVPIPVVVSEAPESTLSITEIPIEDGSVITDHAHSEPFRITLEIATPTLAATYAALVAWQKARVPFTYVSGFAKHDNLLIRRIAAERDVRVSDIFSGRIELQEVKIVSSATAPGDSADAGQNGGNADARGGKKQPGGKDSRRAATPSASRASDAATKNRAAGTVTRGDARTNPVEPARGQSLLKQFLG
ncbi:MULTISPECIES: phage baseplate protein [unclassified Aureimonas]|uniref:phage baseplate protein n=1 Tax=unclassified Aureimonas TaxID=2615206 RepID=UPI0006F371EB|nr:MULTISPECIES: hypothetical protein [unclassified Aureimonas]KQT52226.1 hypothetical protein ASG62_16340 [Aureimonas sp. Leaf427]KQT70540.1 hypothetical protein ASG54_21610 [Aureimonas sp. Leaf460]